MELEFELIKSWGTTKINREIYRAKVFNGWLVNNIFEDTIAKHLIESMVFVPDPTHAWSVE